jgi:hypothetical protein
MSTDFDPEDTLSGQLPSLPPYHDNGGPLDVLHPWHPWDDDHTEATPFFTRLINECGVFATVFAVEERERAKAADAAAGPVRRFMRPLPPTGTGPAALLPPPLPALPAPVVYPPLDEDTLTHEWDTGPGVAIPAADEEPPPRRWRPGGPGGGGRWITRKAPGGA